MAAAILAIKRKNKDRQGQSKPQAPGASEKDSEPPDWAKRCSCWFWFWSKTDLDERFWSYQEKAQTVYANTRVQGFVAALIMGNFLCNIVEKQIDPRSIKYTDNFFIFECFFNIAFLTELLVNMYAHWFWKFFKSSWNWFDLLVVTIGMMSMVGLTTDGPLTLLRNLRAFRVFRLFKRIKSLNKILQALARAVPGVVNAFAVLLLVMSVYAILGVELFGTLGDSESHEITFVYSEGSPTVPYTTPRGQSYGEEYFGNFAAALFTLFQALMGDSWSEAIARNIIYGVHPATGGLYFVSFMVINAIILTNVALAVLLEKVIEDPDADKGDEEFDEPAGQKRKSTSASPPKSTALVDATPPTDVSADVAAEQAERQSKAPRRATAAPEAMARLEAKVDGLAGEVAQVRPIMLAVQAMQAQLTEMRAEQRELLLRLKHRAKMEGFEAEEFDLGQGSPAALGHPPAALPQVTA